MNKRFNKFLAVLLTLTLFLGIAPLGGLAGLDFRLPSLFSLKASAETSGIYTYEVVDGEATITDCDESASGAITIPSTLGDYPVTSIGGETFGAFEGCNLLTSVTIGNSVTSIEKNAFYGCSGLTSMIISGSVTAIGYDAFSNCTGLISVTIGNSVTSIEEGAFDGTPWYNNQPDGLVYAGKVAYRYKGSMPANTSITIKSDTKGIAGAAFYGYTGLTSVFIPASVTSIGDWAFYECSGLTSVTIGNSVTSIGEYAFNGCYLLTNVVIPDSVTSIGGDAFYGCDNLTIFSVPGSYAETYANENSIPFVPVTTAPAAPTGLNSPSKTDTTVSLAWDAVANATGYNVYRGTTKLTASPITTTTYTATGLTQNTTYTFTVKAVNADGESPASAPLSVTTDTTIPAAPTGLTLTGKTDTTVSLSWNPAAAATGYNVFTGATKVNATPITGTGYTVTGLTQNTNYTFAVESVNNGLESATSATISVTTDITVPAAPTGLASPGKTDTTVSLSWNPAVAATGYNVYTGATKVNATPITGTGYTVTGLTQNTNYTFTVKSVNTGVESATGATISVTTDTTVPAAPTGLTSPGQTDTTVSLSWNPAAAATGYNVYLGTTKLTASPITTTTYTATGLTQNTTYSFTVKAVNAGGESSASAPLSVTTDTTIPAAPTGLTSPGQTDTMISLSWDPAAAATGYNVYRGTTKLTASPITTTTYTATGLTQSTTYSFTVKAVNAGGESATGATISVSTDTTVPAPPTGLTSPGKTDTTVSLSWDPAAAATGYNVYRGTTKLTASPITETSYTVTGLTQNTNYTFTVESVNNGLESAIGATISVTTDTTVPAAPTGLSSTTKTDTTVSLAWNAVANATGYNVYRGTTKLTASPITTTTYTATGLAQNTTYTFTVKAVNAGGESPASAPLSVTTNVTKPAVPANVKAVSASYNSIKISWNAVSGATGYVVYRLNPSTGSYGRVKVTKDLSCIDGSRTTGTTYTYKVRAYRTVGSVNVYGNPSAAFNAKPIPAVPANCKAVSASYNSIKISWNAVSGATGYVVYRLNPSTGSYGRVKVTKDLSCIDGLRTTGTTYTYKVRAYRTVGSANVYGNPSAAFSAKPIPATPTNFKAVRNSSTSIKLTWSPVAGASGYVIYRYNTATQTWERLKVLPASSTSYINTGLTPGVPYSYKVRAYRTVGGVNVYGNPTAGVSAKT